MDNSADSTPPSPETQTPPVNPTPTTPATPIATNPLAHANMQSNPTPPTTPPPSESTATSQGSFSEEPTSHSSKKLLVFLIIAVIVLIIAGVMFFMMQGGFTNSATVPTPAPQQTTVLTPTTEPSPTRGMTNSDLEMDSADIESNLNNLDNLSTGVDESLAEPTPNLQ